MSARAYGQSLALGDKLFTWTLLGQRNDRLGYHSISLLGCISGSCSLASTSFDTAGIWFCPLDTAVELYKDSLGP